MAQRRDKFIGCKEGEKTAKADMRGRRAGVWFVAGLSGLGVIAAYKLEPTAPKLENKSLEYQTAYIQAYKSTVKSTRALLAGLGCLSSCIITVAIVGAFLFE